MKSRLKGFWDNNVKAAFPEALEDLKSLRDSMSVEAQVKRDIQDPTKFPEVQHVAEVRKGTGLSHEELEFVHARRLHTREHFAIFIGVDPLEVHPDDIPTVAFGGGSGGGYRAMLGTLAYCNEMKKTGLWDLLTYVAGVSGTCWSLAAYYTFGNADFARVINHCKNRLYPDHPLSTDAIRAVLNSLDGHYNTIGPIIQKSHSGLKTVPMDLYAAFTTGHLCFMTADPVEDPTKAGQVAHSTVVTHRSWYKWSNACKQLQHAQEPLPILTAIRHERPWRDWVDKEHPFREPDHEEKEHQEAKDAWFQWFEISPFEVGCDELEAYVPTWAFGRPFAEGKSTMQLPEQSLAILLGLCVSAPAGPLTSYLATVQRNLPSGLIGDTINGIARTVNKFWGKQGAEEFRQHHPLHAINEHNFLFHFTPVKDGEPRPDGIENSPRIHLIDSGMDNNCPTYVLLHPAREVDVILNMDASSDVQKDSFQLRVDQIGSRRGLKFDKRWDVKPGAEGTSDRFKDMYSQIYDGRLIPRPDTVLDSYGKEVTNPPAATCRKECTMVYMPLLPNEKAVPGFDPSTAKFSGSYNLVWTPEQIDMLLKVCVSNYHDGAETLKTALRDAWQRKKRMREANDAA